MSAGHTVGHALADLHCILWLHLSIARLRALMRAAGQPAFEPAAQQHASAAMPLENGHINNHSMHDAAWQRPIEPAEALKGSAKRKRAPEEGVLEAQAKRSRYIADISLNGQPHDRQQPSPASEQGTKSSPSEESTRSLEWRCQRSCQVSIANVACASACLTVAPDAQAPGPSASAGHHQSGAGGGLAEGTNTGQELPQLTVTLQWSSEDHRAAQMSWQSESGAQHSSGIAAAVPMLSRPRCQVRTEPELPWSACQELAAMAGASRPPNGSSCKPQSARQACHVHSLQQHRAPEPSLVSYPPLHIDVAPGPVLQQFARLALQGPEPSLHAQMPGRRSSSWMRSPSAPHPWQSWVGRWPLLPCWAWSCCQKRWPCRLSAPHTSTCSHARWAGLESEPFKRTTSDLQDQMTPLSTCWRCTCQALAMHMMAHSSHI